VSKNNTFIDGCAVKLIYSIITAFYYSDCILCCQLCSVRIT